MQAVNHAIALSGTTLPFNYYVTHNKQGDRLLLDFLQESVMEVKDVLAEHGSPLYELLVDEILEPVNNGPYMTDIGLEFAKGLVEITAYENALMGAEDGNPVPIIKEMGTVYKIVIQLLSIPFVHTSMFTGIHVDYKDTYYNNAKLGGDRAVIASGFFALEPAERKLLLEKRNTRLVSDFENSKTNGNLKFSTIRKPVMEEPMYGEINNNLSTDMEQRIEQDQLAEKHRLERSGRIKRRMNQSAPRVSSTDAPLVRSIKTTEGFTDLDKLADIMGVEEDEPTANPDEVINEIESTFDDDDNDEFKEPEPEMTFSQMISQMKQSDSEPIGEKQMSRNVQIIDAATNRPMITEDGAVFIMREDLAPLPEIPVTHAVDGEYYIYDDRGNPVLDILLNDGGVIEYNHQTEDEYIRNLSRHTSRGRDNGRNFDRNYSQGDTPSNLYEERPRHPSRTGGRDEGGRNFSRGGQRQQPSELARPKVAGRFSRDKPAQVQQQVQHVEPEVIVEQVTVPVLKNSFPVETHQGAGYDCVLREDAPFMAVAGKGFPAKLGTLADEYQVLVGIDNDSNVVELLIEKDKYMDREKHLESFPAVTLGQHEGTVKEVTVFKETVTAKPIGVEFLDEVWSAVSVDEAKQIVGTLSHSKDKVFVTEIAINEFIPTTEITAEDAEAYNKILDKVNTEEMTTLDALLVLAKTCKKTHPSLYKWIDDKLTLAAGSVIRYTMDNPFPNVTLTDFVSCFEEVIDFFGNDSSAKMEFAAKLDKIVSSEIAIDVLTVTGDLTESEDDESDEVEGKEPVQEFSIVNNNKCNVLDLVGETVEIPVGRIRYLENSTTYRTLEGAFLSLGKGGTVPVSLYAVDGLGNFMNIYRAGAIGENPRFYRVS